MSRRLFARSPDLRKLRNDGYDLEIRADHLLVKNVPYVNSQKEIRLGMLIMLLNLAGDATAQPADHVAHFAGEYPCKADGSPLEHIRNASNERTLAPGVVVQHTFSAKPLPKGNYDNYYDKVVGYVRILEGPASKIDTAVTARTFAPIVGDDDSDGPFKYMDTASSRAEIGMVTEKLKDHKICIIGLGGTGSYVLDYTTKTPVAEIHLYDGDTFLQHNAFRSPGAAALADLEKKDPKNDLLEESLR